jgi:SPP1 family predicted phage head-tail adaptor
MRAGRLRHRVTIQQPAETRDAFGEIQSAFTTLQANVPADIRGLRTREFIEAAGTESDITHEIRIRFRTDLRPKMRMVATGGCASGEVYELTGVMDPDGRRRELVCQAVRRW